MKRLFLLLLAFTVLCSPAFAWWDFDWDYRQAVTLDISDVNINNDITNDHVILIDFNSEQTDFWDNVGAAGADVRVVSENDVTAFDYYFQDFNTDVNRMLLWARVTDTFPTGSDLNIRVYYGNSAAVAGQDPDSTLVDFNAVYHADEATGTTVIDETYDFNATASNASVWDVEQVFLGNAALGIDNAYDIEQGTLLDFVPAAGFSISLWLSPNAALSGVSANQQFCRKLNAAGHFFAMFTSAGVLSNTVGTGGTSTLSTVQEDWPADTWVQYTMTWNTTGGQRLYIDGNMINQDESETTLMDDGTGGAFNIGSEAGSNRFNGVIDEIRVYAVGLDDDEVKLLYSSEAQSIYNYNNQEALADLGIEIEITAIDGILVSDPFPLFGFASDGNLTIDFNIPSSNTNDITVDLNFSTVETQGTGASIVSGLALDGIVCDSADFNAEIACSWDWDISQVADGNYFVLAEAVVTGATDFNATSNSMEIDNDVNIQVLVPIDEVTETAIDTSTSSFTVRITDGGVVSTFTGQLDVNDFIIETLTEGIVTIEIDTNTSAIYYSRTYSFLFEFPGEFSLQPFLAPVADSILTTVATISFTTLDPLPGYRLKIFKDTADGRTLIHDAFTDSKGEAAVPFVIADLYEIEVFNDANVLLITLDYIATSTTNDYFIYIGIGGEIIEPPKPREINVFWSPDQRLQNIADFNVTATINSPTGSISTIQFFVTNNDVNLFDSGADTPPTADGNTYTFNPNNFSAADLNFPLNFTVIVVRDDGKEFYFYTIYTIRPSADQDSPFWLMKFGMRESFGCSMDANITCNPLMFIAFFIIVLGVAAIGGAGLRNGQGLTIISLILTSWFTYIAWIPLWIGVLMTMAGVGAMLVMARMD